MNKGMVIFDKPNRCEECPCCANVPIIHSCTCRVTGNYINPKTQPMPWNCPIIPLDQEQMDTILGALREKMKG